MNHSLTSYCIINRTNHFDFLFKYCFKFIEFLKVSEYIKNWVAEPQRWRIWFFDLFTGASGRTRKPYTENELLESSPFRILTKENHPKYNGRVLILGEQVYLWLVLSAKGKYDVLSHSKELTMARDFENYPVLILFSIMIVPEIARFPNELRKQSSSSGWKPLLKFILQRIT